METIWEGLKGAVTLILSGDSVTYQVIALSLMVSTISTFIGAIIGIPIGFLIGTKEFPFKKYVVRIVYTFMSVPPVVMGLLVFLFLSRKGPFGYLMLIYTPTAMIIAQTLLVTPIIIGYVLNITRNKGGTVLALAKTLGASRARASWLLFVELKANLLTGVVTGYGRAISEVGAVMIVGGNIAGHTRVMTTSIAMMQSMGKYDQAIALGIVLLLISFVVQSILSYFQESEKN